MPSRNWKQKIYNRTDARSNVFCALLENRTKSQGEINMKWKFQEYKDSLGKGKF